MKKRMPHFSTSSRTSPPTPKRAAHASTSTSGFLACAYFWVMRLTTCSVTTSEGASKWSSVLWKSWLVGAALPGLVGSTISSNGGAVDGWGWALEGVGDLEGGSGIWRTHEGVLKALGGHLGAHDVHRELDVRGPALGEAGSKRLVKGVAVARVALGGHLTEEGLRTAERRAHLGERVKAARRVERVVEQRLVLLHRRAGGADDVEDGDAFRQAAGDAVERGELAHAKRRDEHREAGARARVPVRRVGGVELVGVADPFQLAVRLEVVEELEVVVARHAEDLLSGENDASSQTARRPA